VSATRRYPYRNSEQVATRLEQPDPLRGNKPFWTPCAVLPISTAYPAYKPQINAVIRGLFVADPVIGARHDTHNATDFARHSAGARRSLCADLPLAEMNADQVHALDHEKTVILIPGGILPGPSALKSIAGKPI